MSTNPNRLRYKLHLPHDIKGFFRSGVLKPRLAYDASGSLRGELTPEGVVLSGHTSPLPLFEAAKVDALSQGKPLPKSGWKYWHIKRSEGLVSLYALRKHLGNRLNSAVEDVLAQKASRNNPLV